VQKQKAKTKQNSLKIRSKELIHRQLLLSNFQNCSTKQRANKQMCPM